MANDTPPKRESPLSNPQVLAAVIGGVVTVIVAIIGIVPALVKNDAAHTPQPTLIVVTATPQPTTMPVSVLNPTSISLTAPATDPPPAATLVTVSQPQLTPPAGNILLLYDEVSFTLRNQSGQIVTLQGITFSSPSGQWEARNWGPSVYDRLPGGKCLRLRDATVGQRQPPASCRDQIFGLQEVGTSALFWIGVETFEVLRDGQAIVTCRSADGTCLINV